VKHLEKDTKYLIICVVFLLLILPVFFGLYAENLFFQIINNYTLLTLFGGLVVLLTVGEIIDIFGFNTQSLELIKENDVIQSLITRKKRFVILTLFLIIMITEELVFRYYLIGFLNDSLNLDIILVLILSSVFFSLYHIHMWFKFKNIRILIIFLGNSLLLGFFLAFIYLTLGFIVCVIIHYLLAFLFYFSLFNRYFKT
jgi:membrane protease YdiL (CAAX protease family)